MTRYEQQFIDWLKHHDPFMYLVVRETFNEKGAQLGSWGTVFSSIGSAVAKAAPAYMNYRQSKDAAKLAKAQLKFQQQQAAQAAKTPPPPPPAPTPPAPNTAAVNEILARLQLAQRQQPQPPTTQYQPFVAPNQFPTTTQFKQAVAGTVRREGLQVSPTMLLYGGGIAIFLLLLITRLR